MLFTAFIGIRLIIETSSYFIKLKTPLMGTLIDVRKRYNRNLTWKSITGTQLNPAYYFITY